ncbi:hypothetical protein [Actinomadura sp. WMMA1423]|nr:hypothetical protein [Actinomadura sp. WMMA1423]
MAARDLNLAEPPAAAQRLSDHAPAPAGRHREAVVEPGEPSRRQGPAG